MTTLRAVLSWALLGLAWSVPHHSGNTHHYRPSSAQYNARHSQTGYATPGVTTATNSSSHIPAVHQVSSPAYQNRVHSSRTSAPAFHNAQTFQNGASSSRNSAQTFRSSAPTTFQSSAPSTFKTSVPTTLQSSAPSSSFQNSAPSTFQSSAPSTFQSRAPYSSGSRQPFGTTSGSSGPRLVGRQRISPPSTRGQSLGSRQYNANRQRLRQAIRGRHYAHDGSDGLATT